MKSSESSDGFKPFENLQAMLDSKLSTNSIHENGLKSIRNNKQNTTPRPVDKAELNSEVFTSSIQTKLMPSGHKIPASHPECESKLFLQAMQDVTPIPNGKYLEKTVKPYKPVMRQKNTDSEILTRLKRLVNCGEGFVVADTPEYMEGTGYNVNPEIMTALHRGDFSIQDHIDLHGLTVSKAKVQFNAFLKDSIRTGKRGILIVHGRGLSSPQKPVLKLKVYEWLTRGPWRKWIIAFTSARAVDGGAGATYVLLRRQAVTKRLKKKKGLTPKSLEKNHMRSDYA